MPLPVSLGQPIPKPEVILRIKRKLPRGWTLAAQPMPSVLLRGSPSSPPSAQCPWNVERTDLLLQVQRSSLSSGSYMSV